MFAPLQFKDILLSNQFSLTSSERKAGSPIEAFTQGPTFNMLSQTCRETVGELRRHQHNWNSGRFSKHNQYMHRDSNWEFKPTLWQEHIIQPFTPSSLPSQALTWDVASRRGHLSSRIPAIWGMPCYHQAGATESPCPTPSSESATFL